MKRIFCVLLCLLISFSASACGDSAASASNRVKPDTDYITDGFCVRFTKGDVAAEYDKSSPVIELADEGSVCADDGVKISGDEITITQAGEYILHGELSRGRIIVDAPADAFVHLVMNSAKIENNSRFPLFIKSADSVVITAPSGTRNSLSDGKQYVVTENDELKAIACLYSCADLTVNGNGTLIIDGKTGNGIYCEKTFKLTGCYLTVTAEKSAVLAVESIVLGGGNVKIESDGCAFECGDEENPHGFIYIIRGTFKIDADDDALCAGEAVIATGGKITAQCGGKVVNCIGVTNIAEGVIK